MLLTAATSTDEGKRAATVAVLPVGSCEQHGDHLPLTTDTIVACVIANRLHPELYEGWTFSDLAMTSRSGPATTKNNTAQPQPDNAKGDHETEGSSVGVDDEAIAFWDDTCAAMPPLSPATIEAIALIVRRIDQRRAQQ